VPLSLHMYKSMFRPEVIRRFRTVLLPTLQNFHPCLGYQKSTTWLSRCTLNFCLYTPCAMCLSWFHFHTCFVSEPNCNCCLSNKYTQLRSPEVTRVNFLSILTSIFQVMFCSPFFSSCHSYLVC